MKTRQYNYNWLILIFLFLSEGMYSQSFTETKKMSFAYAAISNAEVNISNKYGDVMVIPSNTDSVKIDIEISAVEKKKVDAIESLNRIDIKNTSSSYMINLETLFKGSKNDWKTDLSMMTSDLFNSVKKIRINYTIHIPNNLSITISNKYGNIYMDSHSGRVNIYLENGDFRAGQLSGKTLLNHSYGTATIQGIQEAQMTLFFVNLSTDDAQSINLSCKSSDIVIGKVNGMILDSRKDKFNIREIGNISGSGYFSTFVIGNVSKQVNLTLSYGDFSIQKWGDSIQKVSLIGDYNTTILPLNRDPKFFYDIDATNTKISIPKMEEWRVDTINEEKKMYHYQHNEKGNTIIYLRQSGGRITLL